MTARLGWRDVRAEVLRRIETREWRPGEAIPNEADLAADLGCARATVNRALRSLSDAGLLDRRRKAGTRVAPLPEGRAVVAIPLIRQEIEAAGRVPGYRLVSREVRAAPGPVAAVLGGGPLLHVVGLHLGDGAPFALEDRWINSAALPEALEADFAAMSANEWLLRHAPFTSGEIAFSAVGAGPEEAAALGCGPGAALFRTERRTRAGDVALTAVTLTFAPGYRLSSLF